MPKITVPVSDLLTTVERPIIFDIVRTVQDLTGISSKTQIRYYGEGAKAAQWNSTISKDSHTHNLWPHVENMMIEVEEDYATDRMLNMQVHQPEVPLVFLDEALGITIKPVFSPQTVIIKFKYLAKDRNQAIRWRNDIRTRTAMNRDINQHTIEYSWRFPDIYYDILHELHTLRENVAGYGDSFEQYFCEHATARTAGLTNLSATAAILTVSERQTGIQGLFDFEGVPEKPEKEDESEVWSLSFSYRFTYDKPIEVAMAYPYFVHQQVVSEKYRISNRVTNPMDQWLFRPASGEAFSHFQSENMDMRKLGDQGISLPSFDYFMPMSIPPTTLKVFTALTSITAADRRSLLNLSDLGDFNLDQDILNYIGSSEAPYLQNNYNSIFCLNLYEGSNLMEDGILSVDTKYNVVAIKDLDLRKEYRVRLSLVADMAYLTTQARDRLKAFPRVLDRLISAINQALVSCGNQSDLKNALRPYDYFLLGRTEGRAFSYGGGFVQSLFIQTSREPKELPVVTPKIHALDPLFIAP